MSYNARAAILADQELSGATASIQPIKFRFVVNADEDTVIFDPRTLSINDKMRVRRLAFTRPKTTDTVDLFYPAYELSPQPPAKTILIAPEIESVENAQCDRLANLHELMPNIRQSPFNKILLRAMLTQALIAYEKEERPVTDAESKTTGLKQQAQYEPTKQDDLRQIIHQILYLCYAAGYAILEDFSLCAINISKEKIDYMSFLELAYRCGFYYAIETFYQFGHAKLTEAQLSKYIHVSGQLTAPLMCLALFYQKDLSKEFQEQICKAILDKESSNFSDAIDRFQVVKVLLLFSNHYQHGWLSGGTTRIRQLVKEFFTTYDFSNDEQSIAYLFQGFFTHYAKYDRSKDSVDAVATIQKYQSFREEELTAPSAVIDYVVKHPPIFSLRPQTISVGAAAAADPDSEEDDVEEDDQVADDSASDSDATPPIDYTNSSAIEIFEEYDAAVDGVPSEPKPGKSTLRLSQTSHPAKSTVKHAPKALSSRARVATNASESAAAPARPKGFAKSIKAEVDVSSKEFKQFDAKLVVTTQQVIAALTVAKELHRLQNASPEDVSSMDVKKQNKQIIDTKSIAELSYGAADHTIYTALNLKSEVTPTTPSRPALGSKDAEAPSFKITTLTPQYGTLLANMPIPGINKPNRRFTCRLPGLSREKNPSIGAHVHSQSGPRSKSGT